MHVSSHFTPLLPFGRSVVTPLCMFSYTRKDKINKKIYFSLSLELSVQAPVCVIIIFKQLHC